MPARNGRQRGHPRWQRQGDRRLHAVDNRLGCDGRRRDDHDYHAGGLRLCLRLVLVAQALPVLLAPPLWHPRAALPRNRICALLVLCHLRASLLAVARVPDFLSRSHNAVHAQRLLRDWRQRHQLVCSHRVIGQRARQPPGRARGRELVGSTDGSDQRGGGRAVAPDWRAAGVRHGLLREAAGRGRLGDRPGLAQQHGAQGRA
mmetsp:Transcript_28703/g.84747  ORF Transcript_28703/g.84747 Transcript_28703/m.84747 type:complete len:203 (+) Transcript_28703:287-895(+)